MKKVLLISYSCLLALFFISIKCSAQPNNNKKQNTAPDLYQKALKANTENIHLIESNQFKFDTTTVKPKEIDYSQNNALEIMLLKLTSLIAKYVSTNSIEFLENELPKNQEVNNYREFLYEMMRDINSNNIVAVLVVVLDRLKELIKS